MRETSKNTKDEKAKMERNEMGYPRAKAAECPESDEATLFDKPLAYAYVPIQRWRMIYPTNEALSNGTLFEELYKPMEVYGNE